MESYLALLVYFLFPRKTDNFCQILSAGTGRNSHKSGQNSHFSALPPNSHRSSEFHRIFHSFPMIKP